ncbi:MAG: hypothetical protein ACRCUP_00900 [Mycoplasmatales bacterium]
MHKKTFIVFAVMLIGLFNVNAQFFRAAEIQLETAAKEAVYDPVTFEEVTPGMEAKIYAPGDTICTQTDVIVNLDNPQNSYFTIDILNSVNSQLLDSVNVNTVAPIINFKSGITDITLQITKLDDSFKPISSTEVRQNYKLKDCTDTKNAPKYSSKQYESKISVENQNIIFSKANTDLKLTYGIIGTRMKQKNLSETVQIENPDNNVIQFIEEYTTDGKVQKNFYELEVNQTNKSYFVRSVSSFDVKLLNAQSVINVPYTILLAITISAWVFLTKKIRKLKTKKANKEISCHSNPSNNRRRRRNNSNDFEQEAVSIASTDAKAANQPDAPAKQEQTSSSKRRKLTPEEIWERNERKKRALARENRKLKEQAQSTNDGITEAEQRQIHREKLRKKRQREMDARRTREMSRNTTESSEIRPKKRRIIEK